MHAATNRSNESGRQARYYSAVTAFIADYKGESDRAAVISIAARVDYLLYQILSKCLVPASGARDELLDQEQPLGTFSARIHMCYRLGLIDAAMARAFHVIRRLAADMAQETRRASLRSSPHVDLVKEITVPLTAYRDFREFRSRFFPDSPEISADFYAALAIMTVRLESFHEEASPVYSQETCTFIPPSYREKQMRTTSKKDTQRLALPENP